MRKFVLAGLLLILYLYGGSYAITSPGGVLLLWAGLAGVAGWLGWLLVRRGILPPSIPPARGEASRCPSPPMGGTEGGRGRLLYPAFYLLAVSLLSAALQPPGVEALWRLAVLWLAVALLLLLDDLPLDESLWLFGWLWPLVWWLWPENQNIAAVWPLLFVMFGLFGWQGGRVAGWQGWRWVFVGLHVGLLLWIGSRGALLGLAVAVTWPLRWAAPLPPHRGESGRSPLWGAGGGIILYGLGLAGLAGALYWLRPETAGYRFHYWRQALEAWASAPLLGIGPGQLWAGQWVDTYPGSGMYTQHAHNMALTTLAETGLIGLAALVWLVSSVVRHSSSVVGWQRSALLALAVWSLVDEPLWWPGPLFLSILIIRSRK